MDYVGSKYGQSAKASIIAGKLVVTEVNKSLLKKFKTKEDQKKYLAGLECWEEEEYLVTKDDYHKFSSTIRTNSPAVYSNLFTICSASLQNRLESEPEYQVIVQEDGYGMIVLYKLVKKICNGSSYIVVNNMLGNVLEAMYNFIFIKDDKYLLLVKYLEIAKQQFDVLKESGFNMASKELRDAYIAEIKSCRNITSDLY